jgi:hypothetical protein
MLYLALATTGVKCLTKCGNISRLPVAAAVRVGLGQGNPRTPRRPASRAATRTNSTICGPNAGV